MVDFERNNKPELLLKSVKIGCYVILSVVFLLGTGLLYLNSDAGRKTLVDNINNAMSSPTSTVEIMEIKGSLFSEMSIPSVTVADTNGIWLDVQNININWSPFALFRKTFHAFDIAAETVIIKRTPESADTDSGENSEPFSLPTLPIDLEIDHYGISTIYWGTELVDATSDFSLDGNLKLTNDDGVSARLELLGPDQNSDNIRLDFSYPQDGSNLSIQFDLAAAVDGLLASMSGLALKQHATVKLSGEGPIINWHGDAQVSLGNSEISKSIMVNTEKGFSLQSKINIAQFLPNELRELAGTSVDLDLNIDASDEMGRRAILGEISNGIAKMGINSSIMPTETVEIGETLITLSAMDVAPINNLITPAFIEPFEITGAISDIPTTPFILFSLDEGNLGIHDQISMTLSGDVIAVIDGQNIKISTAGDITNMTGAALAATGEVFKTALHWNIESNHDLNSGILTADTISLTNNDLDISGEAIFDSESGSSEINISSSLHSVAATLEKLGVTYDASGAMKLELNTKQENSTAPFEATLSLSSSELTTESDIVNQLIGADPTIEAKASRDIEGNLSLTQFAFDADLISASATANLSAEQNIDQAVFNINLQDLEKLADVGGPAMNGNIDIDGKISGTMSKPSLNIATGLNLLNLQGLSLSDFEIEATLNDLLGDLNGSVTSKSESNYGPFKLDISIARDGENIALSNITAALGDYNVAGSLQLPGGAPMSGDLSITTSEQENSQSLIDGVITVDLSLENSDNVQRVTVNGNLRDILYTPDPSTTISLEKAEISGDLLLPENNPQITLNADLINMNHPQLSSNFTSIQVTQSDQGLDYLVSLQGTETQPFELELAGNIISSEDGARLISAGLIGNVNETPISFSHLGDIRVFPNQTQIPNFTLGLGDGQIEGTANLEGDTINVNVNANNADLRPFISLVPELPLSGILNGSASYQKTQDAIASEFELSLSDIIFDEKTSINASDVRISATGNLSETSSEISGVLSLPQEFEATFDAVIPLETELTTNTITISQAAPMNGSVLWNGEISPLWPALKLIDHDLSGNLDGKIQISGTIEKPGIDGTISVSDGRYENMQTGFVASDIDLAASIEDRVFTLDRFNANDGEDGTIIANAEVKLNSDYSFDARTELKLQNAKLVRQPELSIEATTDLLFVRNSTQTSLSGEIVVDNADIGAIEQGGPSITTLDVTEINGEGIVSEEIPEEDALGPVDLDLALLVPGQLFVRSFGLDSEWKADLNVTGTSEEPIIAGTAEQIRGYFEFSGKRFELTRGSFSFPGDQTNDPIIEIAAEHQLTDMIANLRIYGRASNPSLEMSSTPYLPENEVMARILFGASVADLTAVEAVQLASAVHSLSNGGGQGLMGGVRRAIGVDRLSIDNDGSREYGTTITGGKYLTDNVYVEVSTAPATGQTATSVEVGLTRNLSLVTRRTLDHDNNLSIRWSWDY